MIICYLVYREDNVMVFQSQVLEYLTYMKKQDNVDSIELILFRHDENLKKKDVVENKIKKYVNNFKTFPTLMPPLMMTQLNVDALRLKKYVERQYSSDEQIGVICRGDFATYLAAKAFSGYEKSRILFDNRGLSVEESLLSHPNGILHKINRCIKKKAILYAKERCDMYNFVTTAMREYDISQYNYCKQLPYTIIPTLFKKEELDNDILKSIKAKEGINNEIVVSYIGSTEAWQSTEQLINIIKEIATSYRDIKFFILTNGRIKQLDKLDKQILSRITVKSVSHDEIKYYLGISDIGIVIRDDNIVNKVAAPTKIAEYLTSGIQIIYQGNIGILSDINRVDNSVNGIDIQSKDWISKIVDIAKVRRNSAASKKVVQYFDMENRQQETLFMIEESFKNKKVR